jgi:hypothetical protein
MSNYCCPLFILPPVYGGYNGSTTMSQHTSSSASSLV